MCKSTFFVNATDTDGAIVSAEGRYKLSSDTVWTIYSLTILELTVTAGVTTIKSETPDLTIEGSYDLEVRVQDNEGLNSDWLPVDIGFSVGGCAPNNAPTVDAGADTSITLPTSSVSVADATATDSDGTIASIVWSQTSGPSTATIVYGNTLTPNFSDLVEGTYVFTLTVTDNEGGVTTDTVTITVGAEVVSTTYQNTAQSQSFSKNDCVAGSTGSTVIYTVVAGTYTSTISQSDADGQAQADTTANGQNYANANGGCTPDTVYQNTVQSQSFSKDDCATGETTTAVTYTVMAGTYSSTVSQADANAQAQADIATNGQAYANANGTCTAISYDSAGIYLSVGNTSCGDSNPSVHSNRIYIDPSYSLFLEVGGKLKINNTGFGNGFDTNVVLSPSNKDPRSVTTASTTITSSTISMTFLVNQNSLVDPTGSDMLCVLTNSGGNISVTFSKC